MSKKFAVFDIDGTLIRWQLFHTIVYRLTKQDLAKKNDLDQLQSAMMQWKTRTHPESFKDYEHKVVDLYFDMIKGLTIDNFNQIIKEVFEEYKDQTYTYTRGLIDSLKTRGYMIFAISGSQQEILGLLSDYYGFDDIIGAQAELKDGVFTGKSTTPVFDKDQALNTLILKHGLDLSNSIAVGDSYSDIKMLKIVEQPIAFNPEKKLYEHAKAKGWKIVIERKNVVYELESGNDGYFLVQTN